jgi:YD repeat-containing protein
MKVLFLLALTQCFCAVMREDFANGLWLESKYDARDRLTHIRFPDESMVQYEYDESHLRKVTRISQAGDVLYQHTYDDFDDHGRLLNETHRSLWRKRLGVYCWHRRNYCWRHTLRHRWYS